MLSERFFRMLKALPLIRFALMLGGGMVATFFVAWVLWVLAHGHWPDSVAPDRIAALSHIALASLLIVALVVVSLAWGQAERVKLNVAGNEVDLDFLQQQKAAS
jgi:hypothetical protein